MWINRYLKKISHNLVSIPTRQFIQVKKKQKFKVHVNEIIDLKSYYEDILRFSYISERGIQIIDSSHLKNMITFSKSADDLQFTIDAYYNFLGHHTKFQDIVIDDLCLKAIQLDCPQLIFDIIENHNYLGYYPHTHITESLVQKLIDQNDIENVNKINQILFDKILIKKTVQLCTNLVDFFIRNDDKVAVMKVIEIIKQQGLKMNQEQIQQLNRIQLEHNPQKKHIKDLYKMTTLDSLDYWLKYTIVQLQMQNLNPKKVRQLLNKIKQVHKIDKDQQLDQKQFQEMVIGLKQYCQNNESQNSAVQMLDALKADFVESIDKSTVEVVDQSIDYVKQNCMVSKDLRQMQKQKKQAKKQDDDDDQQDQNEQENKE